MKIINENNILTLLEGLISNSYPVKSLAIINFFLEERDNFLPENLHRIKLLMDMYNMKATQQVTAGFIHSKAIKNGQYKNNSKKNSTPFTTPSFKEDFRGGGECNGCHSQVVPGPAFFLCSEHGEWKVWHALPTCFPAAHKQRMMDNKKFIAWSRPAPALAP
jgi:hypothetical protein